MCDSMVFRVTFLIFIVVVSEIEEVQHFLNDFWLLLLQIDMVLFLSDVSEIVVKYGAMSFTSKLPLQTDLK